MVKLRQPKRVTILNGRTFLARYTRKRRGDFSANATIKCKYKRRAARNGQ